MGMAILWAMCAFIQIPVITEEVIKICSIVGPERLIFATGLLQTASQIGTAILGSTMGYFFDMKDKIWTSVGGAIMAFFFVLSLVFLILFNQSLKNSGYYHRVEGLRSGEVIGSFLAAEERDMIHEYEKMSRGCSMDGDEKKKRGLSLNK
jgi:intracellular septation protein A